MELDIYQVDAFTDRIFTGNPAAVCPLQEWLPDALLQAIAAENNLSETAFFVAVAGGYQLRWFTPTSEVDLCGHATLASAYVLFEILGHNEARIRFESLSGELHVGRSDGLLVLDFPARPPQPHDIPEEISLALGVAPQQCLQADDLVAVYPYDTDITVVRPDFRRLEACAARGVIITARAFDYDFVARYFAPKYGIPEDPVTGSAYTQLVPFWAERLGKRKLHAKQVSARGGELFCELAGNRVLISGSAVPYLRGSITVPDHLMAEP